MNRFLFNCILLLLMFPVLPLMAQERVSVSSQADMDRLIAQINKGESVEVFFSPGRYEISSPIIISGQVVWHGNNTIISNSNPKYSKSMATSNDDDHYEVPIQEPLGIFPTFISQKDNSLVYVSEYYNKNPFVNKASGLITKLSSDSFAIPVDHFEIKSISKNTFGYIDSWYTAPIFSIQSYTSSKIICKTEKTITNSSDGVDGESRYNELANFVLYNCGKQADRISYSDSKIFIPNLIDKVEVLLRTKLYPIEMKSGNAYFEGISFTNTYNLFHYTVGGKEKSIVSFKGCSFINVVGTVIKVGNNTNNLLTLKVENCNFENCSTIEGESMIYSWAKSPHQTQVELNNSVLNRYPSGFCYYKNSNSPMYISGDFKCIDNVIMNTPRDHVWANQGIVIISNNVINNSDEFNLYSQRNFSRDGGAIYVGCFTNSKEEAIGNKDNIATITGNTITGISGKGDIRGIFIDDGRGDVLCENNVVLVDQFYSIDARNAYNKAASCRVILKDNVLSIPYRLTYNANELSPDLAPKSINNIILGEGKPSMTNASGFQNVSASDYSIKGYSLILLKKYKKYISKSLRKAMSFKKHLD